MIVIVIEIVKSCSTMQIVSDIAIFVLKRDVKLQLTNSTMQKIVIEIVFEIVIEICVEQTQLFQCNRFHWADFRD